MGSWAFFRGIDQRSRLPRVHSSDLCRFFFPLWFGQDRSNPINLSHLCAVPSITTAQLIHLVCAEPGLHRPWPLRSRSNSHHHTSFFSGFGSGIYFLVAPTEPNDPTTLCAFILLVCGAVLRAGPHRLPWFLVGHITHNNLFSLGGPTYPTYDYFLGFL